MLSKVDPRLLLLFWTAAFDSGKNINSFFITQATMMRRSTVLRLPLSVSVPWMGRQKWAQILTRQRLCDVDVQLSFHNWLIIEKTKQETLYCFEIIGNIGKGWSIEWKAQ
jgi:hypothetical protein